MNNNYDKLDALIRVRFLLTKEGGRKRAVDVTLGGEYHATLEIGGIYLDCWFRGDNNPKIYELGEWYNVYIKFLNPSYALQYFSVGKPISLWEGKTVAEGFVEKILRQPCQ